MPISTTDQITTATNLIIEAQKKVRSIQPNLTSNPKIDKKIGKIYSELQEVAAMYQSEFQTLDT
jgi:hypothetical protein